MCLNVQTALQGLLQDHLGVDRDFEAVGCSGCSRTPALTPAPSDTTPTSGQGDQALPQELALEEEEGGKKLTGALCVPTGAFSSLCPLGVCVALGVRCGRKWCPRASADYGFGGAFQGGRLLWVQLEVAAS